MIHNDHLGTPQKMTDSSGTVVWAADYKPFGEATITVGTITNNLRFPGQYFDAETGLNYNYFRDYNPVIGRYIEKDPIGFRGGINLFAYVGGNPINRRDSRGLCSSLSQDCLRALKIAGADESAVTRAKEFWVLLQTAANIYDIDPALLAAIGIRETGFRNISQIGGGLGRGIFQIDLGVNPSVTEADANEIAYATHFAAHMLAMNMDTLSTKYPNLTSTKLLQATAASYNFGTANISGNPNTIDVGSTGNNYGSNILALMNCFK